MENAAKLPASLTLPCLSRKGTQDTYPEKGTVPPGEIGPITFSEKSTFSKLGIENLRENIPKKKFEI